MDSNILKQLFGNSAEKEFGLGSFNAEEKTMILQKIEERLQTVILETAVSKMTDDQFAAFQQIVEGADQNKMQEEIVKMSKNIPSLADSLKENIAKEIETLKKIVKG